MLKFIIGKKGKTPKHQFVNNHENILTSGKHNLQSDKEKFNNILSFAKSVLDYHAETNKVYKKYNPEINDHPILDVVRLVGRNLQTKYLTSLLYHEDETSLDSLFPEVAFFGESEKNYIITDDGKTLIDFKKEVKTTKTVDLNKDLILPWPWKRSRLISTICNIGEHRRWGKWEHDSNNHYVELWLPLGIIWVNGGNHSIASGILQGHGTLKPEYTYDISEIYEYIYTDGMNYYRKEDNSVICPVKDVDFAALFEIGRMMKEHCITF